MKQIESRLLLLFIKIVFPLILLVILSGFLLYQKMEYEKKLLMEHTVLNLAELIASVYQFDKATFDDPRKSDKATLLQIKNMFQKVRQKNDIDFEYLVAKKHQDHLDFIAYSSENKPPAVSMSDSHLAIPMKKALSLLSGVEITSDYVENKVFSAYTSIKGTPWGLVIKQPYERHIEPFKTTVIYASAVLFFMLVFLYQILKYYEIKNKQRIKESEDRFKSLIESTSDWVWEIDAQGKYQYVSSQVKDVLGYEISELLGKSPFHFMPKKEANRVTPIFEAILQTQSKIVNLENKNIHKDGSEIVLLTNGSPFFDEKGVCLGFRGINKDITSRKTQEKALKTLAFTDPLTGLRNRLTLEQDIEHSIEYYQKNHSEYAVLMLDIDWFKNVNDTYGHDVGDIVLKDFSQILLSSVREYDKVYRAGGEEFVILLNRIGAENAINFAQKIRILMQENIFKVAGEEFSKTVSIGLYHSSFAEIPDVGLVLKSIDTALYTSKTNGRNRVTHVQSMLKEVLSEESIGKTSLVFSDKTLATLLEVVEPSTLAVSCDIESIQNKTKDFKSFLHSDDIYLLEDMDLSNDKTYVTTLRIINDTNEVKIYKVEIYINDNNKIVLSFQNAKEIAKQVSDATLIKNLHAMLENSNDYIYFKDRNHVFTTASETLVSITTLNSREEFVGKIDYDIFDKELADEYFKLERKVFDGKLQVAQELQPTEDNDGNKVWVDNRKYPIHDEDGTIIGLFGIARVISDYEYSQGNKGECK